MPEFAPSQQLLQGIFDASLSSILVVKANRDEENRIVDFVCRMYNKRANELFTWAKQVLEVGKSISEVHPTFLRSENFNRWVHTLETGQAYQGEYFIQTEGLPKWLKESVVKYDDGLIVTSEDITEQKQKEDKLKRSEALLLESQAIAQLGAFQWNEELSEGYWTEQLFHIYGIEPFSVKVTPELIASTIHPEDQEKFREALSKVKTTREPYSVEYRVITSEGSIRHVWAKGKMVNGKLTGAVMDITERKLQEEKLKYSEELLQESQQIAQLGTFQLHENGDIFWSEQMYTIFEVDPSQKITTALLENMVHPDDRETFLENVKHIFNSPESRTIEYKAITPTGKLKHIWSRAKMVNGKFTGAAMDITERKELELKNIQLAHRNTDLDNFVFTASHDLRSPVNHIEKLVGFLQEEIKEENENIALYIGLLNKTVVDLKTTLQDLTTVTEIHTGEKKELVDLQKVIEEVKEAHDEQIQEAKATIQMDLAVPFLHIPKRHARSLLYNLFSNALKFRSKDRLLLIQISTRLQKDRIQVSFSDNGIGIRKEDQEKLFIIFKRFHPQIAGRGVGMHLVKRIVELNEGHIYVESEENVGTTFHIDLPKTK